MAAEIKFADRVAPEQAAQYKYVLDGQYHVTSLLERLSCDLNGLSPLQLTVTAGVPVCID